jgi:hypothetical protein
LDDPVASGAAMIATTLCSMLVLLLIGWVLSVNAKDRKTFEKQRLDDAHDH